MHTIGFVYIKYTMYTIGFGFVITRSYLILKYIDKDISPSNKNLWLIVSVKRVSIKCHIPLCVMKTNYSKLVSLSTVYLTSEIGKVF